MARYFEVSQHDRHILNSHHPSVAKNDEGIRGTPSDWRSNLPTPQGYIDLGYMAVKMAGYTKAVWEMDPHRDVAGPMIAIATSRSNEHCRRMGQLVARSLQCRGDLAVVRHELAELDSIPTPPLIRRPPDTLDSAERYAVERFIHNFTAWEAGAQPGMPDPRTVGSTMSPSDYVERALRGQQQLARITDAHVVLSILTTTALACADAALSPDVDEVLATGIFPPTLVGHGQTVIYEQQPFGQPVRITAEPVSFRHLLPPRALPSLDPMLNGMSTVPYA